jgi:phosphatidylserine decarboxylase precursor
MKKNIRFINTILLLLVIAFQFSCTSKSSKEDKAGYGEATRKLVKMIEEDSALKSMLISSLGKAKEINPDKNTNPVQSLEEYYEFISWAEISMPWALVNKKESLEIYENTFQSLCYFYFLIDQPLTELEGKGYFNNSLQYSEPFASWVTTFSKSWGKFLDTEDSWNEEYYQMILNDPAFGLQNDWYENPSNWRTFNQFFARYLRSPAMRPIAAPDDNSIVASFADSEPQGVWAIDSNSNIIQKNGVPVKSATLNSIAELLGKGSQYKNVFANGTFTHSFLNVNDYHRYHFPLGGTVKEARIIPGINPAGGKISWDAQNNRYAFDPSSVGWQMLETRGCVILETDEYGLVALLPIGMATVGSVNLEENIREGTEVNKGDMLGYFLFGGSDFIILFQEHVKFTLDVPMKERNEGYEHLLMGERLGHLSKR